MKMNKLQNLQIGTSITIVPPSNLSPSEERIFSITKLKDSKYSIYDEETEKRFILPESVIESFQKLSFEVYEIAEVISYIHERVADPKPYKKIAETVLAIFNGELILDENQKIYTSSPDNFDVLIRNMTYSELNHYFGY